LYYVRRTSATAGILRTSDNPTPEERRIEQMNNSDERARTNRWEARASDDEDARLTQAMNAEGIWSKSDAVRKAVEHWCRVVERRHRQHDAGNAAALKGKR
jgi:hypothetical protein